jgi:hypothetical protein
MDKDIPEELKLFGFCGQKVFDSGAFGYIPMG